MGELKYPGRAIFMQVIRFSAGRPKVFAGAILLTALTVMALLAPYIVPYDPKATGTPFLSPCPDHLLGTNDMGQDLFSQLLCAARISLLIGFMAAIISISIGAVVGIIAGFYRGRIEDVLMGMTDATLLIPGLPLMIIFAAYLKPSLWNIVIVVGLLWWCPTARLVHSRVLQVREMPFIESTKAIGYSNAYIIASHVLVNTSDVILAKFTMAVASAMLSEASLSFLGLGDPFNVSWGGMINMAFNRGGFLNDQWWWYLPPGLMICLSVLSFIMLSSQKKKDARYFGLL